MHNLIKPTMLDSTRLENGATLLEHFGRVVLAFTSGYHPYVTWYVCENGGTVHGHYHKELPTALLDFAERVESDVETTCADLRVYSGRKVREVRRRAIFGESELSAYYYDAQSENAESASGVSS